MGVTHHGVHVPVLVLVLLHPHQPQQCSQVVSAADAAYTDFVTIVQ